MDINTVRILSEVDQIIKWVNNLKPGIYELMENYKILKELTFKNEIFKQGEIKMLKPSSVKNLPSGCVKIHDDAGKKETIRKIKQYIDFRIGTVLPDIEFNNDYSKIRVYDRIQNTI